MEEPIEQSGDQTTKSEPLTEGRLPDVRSLKGLGLIWFAAVLPAICHIVALLMGDFIHEPDWQTGHFSTKFGFLIRPDAGWPVILVHSYSAIALTVALVWPRPRRVLDL